MRVHVCDFCGKQAGSDVRLEGVRAALQGAGGICLQYWASGMENATVPEACTECLDRFYAEMRAAIKPVWEKWQTPPLVKVSATVTRLL